MVSAYEGFKVLGTQFTLLGRCSAEIRARISGAWAKFHYLWPILGKRDGNLQKRLRLFDTTVSQTLLWCCESWLITQKEKQLIKTTQNAMLRRIAGPRRKPEEPWLDWIKRSTRKAVGYDREARVRIWIDAHLLSKYTWAGHVCRMTQHRLALRAMSWRDSKWWATEFLETPQGQRLRRRGRTRWFRWEHELRKFAVQSGWHSWQTVALTKANWHANCANFVRSMR